MLDRYVTINKELCSDNAIPYLDVRRRFLSALPANYYGYMGCLTIDGEHENENGAIIIANMFSEAILGWIMQ